MNTELKYLLRAITFGTIAVMFSIVQVFAQSSFPQKVPDRIILNLTEDPPSSMAVTWRTDTTINSNYCELQPATDTRINPKESKSFKAHTITVKYLLEDESTIRFNQHSQILSDLKPDTKYIYRVGSKEKWSEWFQFETASNKGGEFSFIYFGDPQTSLKSEWSRVVRKAYQGSPNSGFMLYAGDLINRAGKDAEWQEWFE